MDNKRAVDLIAPVRDLYRLLEQGEKNPYGLNRPPQTTTYVSKVSSLAGPVERIAGSVDPDLAQRLRKARLSGYWSTASLACDELIGRLQTDTEVDQILEPGPKLVASRFHRWVWDHAAAYWANGHRRAAVQEAATAILDVETPNKLGRGRDTKGGRDVMGQAFTLEEPEPGAARLRLPDHDKSTDELSWKNAHEGAMYLGMGAAAAIRNLVTHRVDEPDEQEALEMLATLSYVARLVDSSVRVEAP